MHHRRTRAASITFGLLAGVLLLASAAFGCTNLATVNLSTSMAKPGDTVTVTGSGFQASTEEMPMDGMAMGDMAKFGAQSMATTAGLVARSAVVVRWDGPDGPVLADAIPDHSGTISVVFTVPETKSGSYVVVAVQKNPQGVDVYGTPARAPLQVVGPGRPAGDAVRGTGTEGAGQPSSTRTVILLTSLGVLAMSLLAAGVMAARGVAGSTQGVPARVGGGRRR